MKILLLPTFPQDFYSYERSIDSKIHREIKKEIEVQQFMYVFKGQKSRTSIDWSEIEMPFYWNNIFKKIVGILFILFSNIKIINKNKADLIRLEMVNSILDYSMFVYPLFFPKKKFYVETTTPSVTKSKFKRTITNFVLALVLKPYKHIGMVNVVCKDAFKIPESKVIYSQVGYPEYTFNVKDFHNLSLVYLGTISNRDIWKTIVGIRIFMLRHSNVNITYDIIGGGRKQEISLLLETIKRESLDEIIIYHGYQSSEFVDKIFQKCNVGIAFVPLTEYYDKVLTTKALEYLLAGMPIIATRTSFATGIFNKDAGVLCEDTPEDFANGIKEIYNNRTHYSSEQIREIYKNYGMRMIIKNEYIPMLKSLVSGEN